MKLYRLANGELYAQYDEVTHAALDKAAYETLMDKFNALASRGSFNSYEKKVLDRAMTLYFDELQSKIEAHSEGIEEAPEHINELALGREWFKIKDAKENKPDIIMATGEKGVH